MIMLQHAKKRIRYTIRILQEIPLVISFFVFLCYIFDFFKLIMSNYFCPIFGFSFYIIFRLYCIARKLYVSNWSKILYIMLMIISLFELFDNIFFTKENAILANQLFIIIFTTGVFSSFITYLYGKFKSIYK